MATINSISASLYISQTTITVSAASAAEKPEATKPEIVTDSPGADGHRYHGGGYFMRSVVHAFQGLGLSFPHDNADNHHESDRSNQRDEGNAADIGQLVKTFLQDLRQVLTQSRSGQDVGLKADAASGDHASGVDTVPQLSNNAATANASTTTSTESADQVLTDSASSSAPVTTDDASTQYARGDVFKALHGFLHELRRALVQVADAANTGAGGKGDDYGSRSVGWHGYRNFSANLDNLIVALSDGSQASSDQFKSLREDFDRLVNLLDSGSGGAKPSLLEFLNKLKGDTEHQNSAPAGSGTIVSATV
ncbi:hypothetical protein [Methylomonas koyamae]|uniref:hypothetical protein n=1 Tax=Methylomonas koyamae TaxID=702114 RepID=UPI0011265F89|nr:hypothetical protein [Methylomonas koyamae]